MFPPSERIENWKFEDRCKQPSLSPPLVYWDEVSHWHLACNDMGYSGQAHRKIVSLTALSVWNNF
jgi:hypothetical protein